jgi:hypothetical protein
MYFLIVIATLFNFLNSQSVEEVNEFCNLVSDYYKQPREILPAIIRVESDYMQNSISSKGAYGVMQVTKGAYDDYKRILKKPYVTDFDRVKYSYKDNIRVGAWYLFVYLMQIEGLSQKQAITSYFWGTSNLGTKSTDCYYNKVKGRMK